MRVRALIMANKVAVDAEDAESARNTHGRQNEDRNSGHWLSSDGKDKLLQTPGATASKTMTTVLVLFFYFFIFFLTPTKCSVFAEGG
jgi:hypothetical protein